MNEKLVKLARKARDATKVAVKETTDFVRAHAPTDEERSRAKDMVVRTGRAVGEGAVELGKDVARSKTFKDVAKGAAVGALVAVPLPVVGPVIGALLGAGMGGYLGQKGGRGSAGALPSPSKDLHDELLKLDALRQKGLLTEAQFEAQKRKLLEST